jgi:tRNA(adenine34) deaminase
MRADNEKQMRAAMVEAESALAQGDFPVGCVICLDGEIVACGRRLRSQQSKSRPASETDHAEIIALHSLLAERPEIAPDKVIVYSNLEPCLMCYSAMLVNGIRRFVYAYEDIMGGGTNLPLQQLNPLYKNMQVSITPAVMRDESLALFKRFFKARPDYLRGTILADYTLSR